MQENRKNFPLFISLEGKRICIAGAGKIAARRAEIMLSFGAELFITAPDCSGKMRALLQETEYGNKALQKTESSKTELIKEKSEKQELQRKEPQEFKWKEKESEIAGGGKAVYRKRRFEKSDLDGMDLVFAATDDAVLNHEIAMLCRERGLPVNNASCQDDCDFFFPGIVRKEGLTIGVGSGGADHGKVAEACRKLRRFFGISFQDEEG